MRIRAPLAALALCFAPQFLAAQIGVPEKALPNAPFVIDTAEAGQVRVTPMKGLELPWDLAFLPSGDMLVTERTAMRLRVVRNGALVPQPITGLPEGMSAGGGGGLMAVAAHPRFAQTGWVYLTYTKPAETGRRGLGLARGRLDGMALRDVRELFTVDEAGGGPPPGLAADLRAGRLPLLLRRRRERHDRAARRLVLRQGAALQRRWQRAEQSVRGP